MQTKRFATEATIFSRVSAPPPPLIMAPLASISSAPSTYTGISSTSFRSKTLKPCCCRRRVEASELETAPAKRSLNAATASIKRLAVEPVPTPSTEPAGTTSLT